MVIGNFHLGIYILKGIKIRNRWKCIFCVVLCFDDIFFRNALQYSLHAMECENVNATVQKSIWPKCTSNKSGHFFKVLNGCCFLVQHAKIVAIEMLLHFRQLFEPYLLKSCIVRR